MAEATTTPLPARTTAATLPTPDGLDDADGPLRAASSVPVGAAVDPDLLERDGTYAATLLREFNAITPENAMKWGSVHPSRHGWHFDPADRLVEFAEAHRLRVHGHALVWHRQLPRWLTWALSRREVVQALASHVGILVGRYAGRIASWDVVNEAIADDGGLRDTCFLRTCGQDYIAEAFRLAHAADPRARLYYNDYGAEERGRKSDAVYVLLRRLLDDGVPVHGVGLQMHLRGTRPPEPAAIAASVARFLALGLEVRISEMDVRIRRVRRGDPLALQRLVYRDAIGACAAMPGFAGVTFWGMNDTHSWIHREFGKDAPLLFDGNYAPKPAYFGARDGLAAGRKATARPGPSVQPEKEPDRK